MKIKTFFSLLLMMLLSFSNCTKDNAQLIEAQVLISPEILLINANEKGKLFVSVQPPIESEFIVSTTPSFILSVQPSSGIIKSEMIELELSINDNGLDADIYYGIIEVLTNNAGKASVEISFAVDAKPIAHFDVSQIIFEENTEEKTFKITNTGTGFLNWNIDAHEDWLTFIPENGSLAKDSSVEVIARADHSGLEPGTTHSDIVFTSNSIESNPALSCTMYVPEFAELYLVEQEIIVGYLQNSLLFTIGNAGNTSTSWEIAENPDYFTFEPSYGMLSSGEEAIIMLHIDRTEMDNEVYHSTLSIKDNNNNELVVETTTKNFNEEKWLIDGSLVDAEYDRVHDMLIGCFKNPHELRKYDIETKTVTSMGLELEPKSLSISMDGEYAVVGHDAYFTYVNLNTMEVLNIYSISQNVADIVLSPHNWVYVVPDGYGWNKLLSVNLATGDETINSGSSITFETRIRLHPSGDYIYCSRENTVYKFDIQYGVAQQISTTHSLSIGKNFWISETGTRIFAQSGKVYKSSENSAIDLIYNGSLSGSNSIAGLDYSANSERIYTLFSTPWYSSMPYNGNLVQFYETTYLNSTGETRLPGFLIPGDDGSAVLYDSQGQYGFFNSSGSNFYAIVNAHLDSKTLDEWAIVTLDVP